MTLPSLRWLTSSTDVPAGLRAELTACWRDAVNAGGAVGFAEEAPVSADVVAPGDGGDGRRARPPARAAVAGHESRRGSRLAVAHRQRRPGDGALGRITRVQTSPSARGTGVARALLAELHRSAREDLGLESLRLEVRGGWGLEPFYEKFGWTVVGAWPRALRFTRYGVRDEVLMALDLRG